MLPPPPQPAIYTTLPSFYAHRPTLAMDGDAQSFYQASRYMTSGDGFTVLLSRKVQVKSVRIETGTIQGEARLEGADLETTADGATWTKAAEFQEGVAEAEPGKPLLGVRIRLGRAPSNATMLVVREIKLDAAERLAPVKFGKPRGFVDISRAPDMADWSKRAEAQIEAFWPKAESILYSKGFVPPNAVYVVYRSDTPIPIAMTGGGVMTVNPTWCRAHPTDTGLTVHEMVHVVQSGGSPVWLVEAIADYVRWVRFEPEHLELPVDPASGPHVPYRPGGAFLAYCANHYDPQLVTELEDASRFNHYSDALFERYCGKPIDALWAEFVADYRKRGKAVINP